MNRSWAFDTYFKVLTSAIERCRDEIVKERLRKMRNAEIQKDWELWLEERKAILVSRSIQNTNMAVQNRFNTRVKNQVSHKFNFDLTFIIPYLMRFRKIFITGHTGKDKDDKDENDKDDVNKDEDDKEHEDSKFVERHELDTIGRTKRWILSSGTDVRQVLASYRCLIPESQKCMNPIY
ncbi:unnamed protein product [Rhizophagus irregularis]|nr:unnamed protein product [Rhizophagus irregularis]